MRILKGFLCATVFLLDAWWSDLIYFITLLTWGNFSVAFRNKRKIMRIFTVPAAGNHTPEPNFYDNLQKVRLRQQLDMYSIGKHVQLDCKNVWCQVSWGRKLLEEIIFHLIKYFLVGHLMSLAPASITLWPLVHACRCWMLRCLGTSHRSVDLCSSPPHMGVEAGTMKVGNWGLWGTAIRRAALIILNGRTGLRGCVAYPFSYCSVLRVLQHKNRPNHPPHPCWPTSSS